MKKIIFSALAAFAFITYGSAQEIKTDAGTFCKPVKNTTIMEVMLTPDVGGGSLFSLPDLNSDLSLVGIKARRFTSEKCAYRATANVAVYDDGEDNGENVMALALSFGREHHLKGAERLSTYWGYEANAAYLSFEDYGDKTRFMALGANLFTGFDYYIMPKVYLGAELSYGANVINIDPDGESDTTSFSLAPNIKPSLRLGWQF